MVVFIDAVVAPVLHKYEQLVAVAVKVAVTPTQTLALVTVTLGVVTSFVTVFTHEAVQPFAPFTTTV